MSSFARQEQPKARQALTEGPFRRRLPEPWPEPYFMVSLRGTDEQITSIRVQWPGVHPTPEEVTAALGPWVGPDTTVRLDNTRMRSCGYFHETDRDAWIHHVGWDARTLHPDAWEDVDPSCSCCGRGLEDFDDIDIAGRVYDRLVELGETPEPECREGRFEGCPHCTGGRIMTLRPRAKVETCEHCDGRGVFDMNDPDQAAGWAAAIDAAHAVGANRG